MENSNYMERSLNEVTSIMSSTLLSDDDFKVKYNCSKTSLSSESDECVVFQQLDMFSQGFPIMEEIRRQGKLCDVTLKVSFIVQVVAYS